MASPVHGRGEAAASERTRKKLLRAAEELFAREGFDRVTLRQIARASGQGNVAAVQYHFGSKQGLLEAIVDRHQDEVEKRRGALLAAREAQGRGEMLEEMVGVLIEPLIEKLGSPSGRCYLRIQAQTLSASEMRSATRTVVERIGRSLGRDMADPQRNRFAIILLFHALADRARQEEESDPGPADRERFVSTLSDSLCGLLRGHPTEPVEARANP